jgi:RNA polymerase sigma factor (sigma-70 family)
MSTATIPVTAIVTFAAVASLNTAKLARYAFGMCKDANMADDIVQTAMLRVFSKIEKIGEFEVPFLDIEKFVQKVMRNSFWDILKNKKAQRIECSDDAAAALENVSKDTTEIDVFDTLEGVSLNKTESRFVQYMLEGMTKYEICGMLEITDENFRKISQRIRDKVRDSIK